MEFVMLIGRILFGLIFVSSGINHFTQTEGMTGYAQFKKIPSPKLAVQGSGLVLLLGGLSVILGVWADLGAIVLAVLLLVMAVTMHNYWTVSEPQAKQADMIGFWKNVSMAGGAIFMFAVLSLEVADWGFMITGPVFNTSL